jgi:hypothetical protein
MAEHKIAPVTVAVLAMTALLLTVIAAGVLTDSKTVPLSGSITAVNVQIYSDAYCTVPCTSLSVGAVAPGGVATQTIYVKNAGTVPMTLSMAVAGWNPSNAGSYLTLSWDRTSYVLGTGASVQATLTLTAASNTGSLTTFSCSVTITGTQ